jgi:hypothetical protein
MMVPTPAKVGVFTLIALVALGAIIVWKTDIFMVQQGYEMIGSFDNVEGLTVGSEVRYRGFKAGKVMRVDPGRDDIRVYTVISRDVKLPADSFLRVSYDGIVGLKFLEIRPGTSEAYYTPPSVLLGIKTSGIVDFVDVGSQSLVQAKEILETIRGMVQDPKLQAAFYSTIFTADKVAIDLEKLTVEIRQTNKSIKDIVADPKFQSSVKGTIHETEKTLTSANKFFDSVSKINLRASAGVDIGSRSNSVRGDLDVVQSDKNYLRFGLGEGPVRQPSLLDILFNSQLNDRFSFRLGIISNQIGGGIAFYPTDTQVIRGDLYDINNPRPNQPKVRLGYEYEMASYMDLTFKADDLLNRDSRNVMLGIRVKPQGEKVY